MVKKKVLKKSKSFEGWKLFRFLKGRKKTIITVIASVCGYFALNQELTGLIAGPVFEGIWSIAEYYFKEFKK